ncbi:MAG: hypothetical protein AAFU71_00895 [Cyanobacteria bacterium J06632_22]
MTGLGRAGRSLFAWNRYCGRWAVLVTAGLGLFSGLGPAIAQSFPPCPGPAAGEYLLLARGNTAAERERIAAALPAANPVLVCRYRDEVVVRAGGFENLEAANSWALYLRDIEGVETVVAQPAETTAPSATGAYQPQALAAGYAVLVDYDNQPTVAALATTALNQPVGLAVYRQRPYLLAAHTADAEAAAAVLQQLAASDLNAILVESQQVVRLLEAVAVD